MSDVGEQAIIDEIVRGVNIGGLYGINVETLSGNKTLTAGIDKMYQYLDPDDSDRDITLATVGATAGDRFIIRNNGTYNDYSVLQVKNATPADLDKIYVGSFKGFIFDGTQWIPVMTGTGQITALERGLAIGQNSIAYDSGVAVGMNTTGYAKGVAVGRGSVGHTHSVAIGFEAHGYNYSIGVGAYAHADDKKYSIALGYRSKCERTAETSININGADTDQENNVVQGRWERTTTDATPVEIFCGGQAGERFTIRANSALAFKMTIVARDNIAGHVAMYTIADGLIKRDGADNTVMSNCTVTVVHEDDAGWDVAVTADDTNEALIITVTGDATNPTQWAAVMDGVETHF